MDMKTAIGLAQQGATSRETAAVSRRSATRPAQVLLAGRLTALSCFGGADMPMLALARALPDVGVAARFWRPWEDPLAEAGCLHLFGTAEEFLPVVEAARQEGVPVVLSPLAWLADADRPADFPGRQPLRRKVTAWAGYVGRSVCPRWPSRRRQLYRTVDLLLPNSHAEAQQLIRKFQVPSQRVHVVPQGADPRLASADPEPFAARVGSRHFVLYVGSIEPRNNQLGFLLAMRGEDVTIVFLGDPVADCQWYEAECRHTAGPQVHFVAGTAAGDPLRASALAACGCLVVASGVEAPERIALEGGMSGAPLVLFQESPADEYFGHQAIYVEADDLRAVRYGVLAALARKRSASLAEHVRTYFSWSAVAKATREAYGKVLRK
jgi:glycosyltransferase involved in cell wall biosynthesis